MELSLNNILLSMLTVIVASCLYLLLTPKKKKDPVDTTVFDNVIDDGAWAEEEKAPEPAVAPSVPTGAVPTGANARAPNLGAAAPAVPKKKLELVPAGQLVDSKGNPRPFQVGDRVILQKLTGAKELNGRHGVVAAPYDPSAQRYPIDLDLLDSTRTKPLSVKEANLKKEPQTTLVDKESVPEIVEGVLEEHHARTFQMIFTIMRSLVNAMSKGGQEPAEQTARAWQDWNTGMKVYDRMYDHLTKGILLKTKLTDLEKSLNPKSPRGAYQLVTKALRSEQAVKGWNVRVEGPFWLVSCDETGTMVIPVSNTRQVYKVVSSQKNLYKLLSGPNGVELPRPAKCYLTLVPWFGRLVHDTHLMTTTGSAKIELASDDLAEELKARVQHAELEGRVITSLRQLEVEGGSREGLPLQPRPKSPQQPQMQVMIQPVKDVPPPPETHEVASQEERTLIANLVDFDKAVFPPNSPLGFWNCIRFPSAQKSENPNHISVVMTGQGQRLAQYPTKNIEPTAFELLKVLVGICTKMGGKRPSIMGVDDVDAFHRLNYLSTGTKLKFILVKVIRRPVVPNQQQPQQPQQVAGMPAGMPANGPPPLS